MSDVLGSSDLNSDRRNHVLRRIVDEMEADARVLASWLEGSLGRGTSDELSDIDLHTVVQDEHYFDWWNHRGVVLAKAGRVLLTGPPIPSGDTNLDRFQGIVLDGGLVIDWTITALSEAEREADSSPLFEKVPIPLHTVDTSPAVMTSRLQEAVWSFWWMTFVALKNCERGATDRAVSAVDVLRNGYVTIVRLLTDPTRADEPGVHWLHPVSDAEISTAMPRFDAEITPTECLRVTGEVMRHVHNLRPALSRLGVPVPDEAADESLRILGLLTRAAGEVSYPADR